MDLLISICAHHSKFYHLSFGKNISRSNLATVDEIQQVFITDICLFMNRLQNATVEDQLKDGAT
jgi:abortive infection bacteriophage resistance protein